MNTRTNVLIKRTRARRLRRVMSALLLWRGDHVSAVATELVPTRCFGGLGEGEQLALKGFIARDRSPEAKSAA